MTEELDTRRRFLKRGLGAAAFAAIPWTRAGAGVRRHALLEIPPVIHDELVKLYGHRRARRVYQTTALVLDAPEIGEDFSVVPLGVDGAKGRIDSLAILVAESPQALATTFRFSAYTDLPVNVRCKVPKTSDIYVIGLLENILVGVKANVKMTIGCGGG